MSLGPIAVAGAAVALGYRDRLVLALAAGATLLALAWLSLDYPPVPQNLNRLAGHARNLALAALLLALGARLVGLPSRRWRYLAVGALAALVVWPTVAAPARSLAGAMGHGVQLANAGWTLPDVTGQGVPAETHRYRLPRNVKPSGRLFARPHRHECPPAGHHIPSPQPGGAPEHRLRPTGVWRRHPAFPSLGSGIRGRPPLPGTGRVPAAGPGVCLCPGPLGRRVACPRARMAGPIPAFFDLLARDGAEALYRVRPAFLALDTDPHPETFEALRTVVAPGTEVFLPPQQKWEGQISLLRVASVLPHAQLLGTVNTRQIHLRTAAPWRVEPLGAHVPKFIALPVLHEAWQFPPAGMAGGLAQSARQRRRLRTVRGRRVASRGHVFGQRPPD